MKFVIDSQCLFTYSGSQIVSRNPTEDEAELKNGGPIPISFCKHYVSESDMGSATALSNSVHNEKKN